MSVIIVVKCILSGVCVGGAGGGGSREMCNELPLYSLLYLMLRELKQLTVMILFCIRCKMDGLQFCFF